jgi:hypothetical protein
MHQQVYQFQLQVIQLQLEVAELAVHLVMILQEVMEQIQYFQQ